jgi:radical SAM protein with 4Fe4S-binding SPASM domain
LIENRIPVQISCPILKVNYDSYKDVQRWAVDHNISVGIDFSIIARYNHNQENLGCRLSYEELEHIISEKIINDSEYIEDLKKEITENKRKTEDSYICSICNSSICIGPSGNVFPCVGWTNKVVGNIVNNSLYDIWIQSDEVKRLRTIRLKDFIECKGCNFKEYCTICMVRNSNESPTGNPFELSRYFCNIAKIKKELHNKYCSNLKRK